MAALLGFAVAGASAAQTTDDELVARSNREAYEAAVKCFVVDGSATSERERAGDKEKASYYESKARQSFETALKLGDVLGYSGTQMNEDFGLAQTRELPLLVKDVSYYRGAASTCKALGLM